MTDVCSVGEGVLVMFEFFVFIGVCFAAFAGVTAYIHLSD